MLHACVGVCACGNVWELPFPVLLFVDRRAVCYRGNGPRDKKRASGGFIVFPLKDLCNLKCVM